jgi:quercetin dioxygenase-like cupin family protein
MVGYVLRGHIELKAGDDHYKLSEEDSFHLRADLPHRIWNPEDEPAQVILVGTQGVQAPAR